MITRRTRIQLLAFVILTLVGVSFVGARYARLDRLVVDDAYTVVAHFEQSGGIFAGAEVSYRGVRIGRVDKLELTDAGVDVHLDVDNEHDAIPVDSLAVVGNRSAVGEQYVELQPQVDDGPYLDEGAEIAAEDTRTPIATETLLADLSTTVASVDQEALRTTVHELGAAFGGTGEDLQRLIDTGSSFIDTADENFELTAALIRDSNTVLEGQIASDSALRTFARELSLFSGTLAGADPALNRLLDNGSVAARQLRTFLEENEVELADLLNNLVTNGELLVRHLEGVEQLLVIYPYVVEGGFTVVSKSPGTGLYDAHFGLIVTNHAACTRGYESTDRRVPEDGSNRPMNVQARCTEPPTQSNSRGLQNLPRRAAPGADAPVVASYDPESGKLRWGSDMDPAALAPTGSVAPTSLGEESWKWLFLQPLMTTQD